MAKAIAEAEQLMTEEDASPESVRTELPAIRSKYRLVSLELQQAEQERYYVEGKLNPSAKSRIHELGAVEVKKLEELLEGADPTVAAELIRSVKQAQDSHRKATAVYNLLVHGGFMKPRKTIAVSGSTATVSGWKSLTKRQKKKIADEVGLSLEQDAYQVREYYQRNRDKFHEAGYNTKRHWTDPKDKLGLYYHSHAEKQLSLLTSTPSIGVSKSVCADDCYPYLHALAQIRKQELVVADPDGIWVFYANGQVKFLGHKGEETDVTL